MYKFLLVEDSKSDVEACLDTVKRMNKQNSKDPISVTPATTFDEALKELNNDYSGIIVDIKLDKNNNGNDIIKKIIDEYRIPAVIMTGTPDVDLNKNHPMKLYIKGETGYEEILNALVADYSTGLFKVLGGKGVIEKAMNDIFWNNLYPHIDTWKEKKQKGIDCEKFLLRYAIAHIQELLDNDIPTYETEEMYICSTCNNQIRTGSIIKLKNDDSYYIVLSPPCDLAIHDEKMKTDRILVCEIDNQNMIYPLKSPKEDPKKLKRAITNQHTEYYHWLPQNNFFTGGYINFRKINTYSLDDFNKTFEKPTAKVQEFFVKSILNRFSSYYARQGQPDFDFDGIVKSSTAHDH